jgi:hypothetical protein
VCTASVRDLMYVFGCCGMSALNIKEWRAFRLQKAVKLAPSTQIISSAVTDGRLSTPHTQRIDTHVACTWLGLPWHTLWRVQRQTSPGCACVQGRHNPRDIIHKGACRGVQMQSQLAPASGTMNTAAA